jgi:prepilin-type N-terminal cleavage/methylation domain-containing protein
VSDKGLGLIELLISLIIMSILSLGVASIYQMMNSSSNNVNANVGAQSVRATLVQMIAQPGVCFNRLLPAYKVPGYYNATTAATTGLPLGFMSDDGVTQIVGPAPGPSPTPVPLPNYNVSVNYLLFKTGNPPLPSVGLDNNPPNSPLYKGTLVMGLQKMANANQSVTGGNGLQALSVGTLLISVDSNNDIVDCLTNNSTTLDACSAMGGVYNAANIPPCALANPCASNVFLGYDGLGNPVCQPPAVMTVLNCTAGQSVVSNGTGFVCQ